MQTWDDIFNLLPTFEHTRLNTPLSHDASTKVNKSLIYDAVDCPLTPLAGIPSPQVSRWGTRDKGKAGSGCHLVSQQAGRQASKKVSRKATRHAPVFLTARRHVRSLV